MRLEPVRMASLILDLPPDEAEQNSELIFSGGLDPIRLIAPTTPPGRMAKIVATGRGFIYYVSREGVTGEQKPAFRQHICASRRTPQAHARFRLPWDSVFRRSSRRPLWLAAGGCGGCRECGCNGKSPKMGILPTWPEHVRDFVRPHVQATKSA